MKDSAYVMYLWNETEMRRKEKEARKKTMENQKSDVDSDRKKKKDQHGSVEKTVTNKEKETDINDNVGGNAGIGVSFEGKGVHESANETTKEDVGTSDQKNDVGQSPSQEERQKFAGEDVGTSDQ